MYLSLFTCELLKIVFFTLLMRLPKGQTIVLYLSPLSLFLFLSLTISLSLLPSLSFSIHLPMYLSLYLFRPLSLSPSIYLSTSLSIYLSLYHTTHIHPFPPFLQIFFVFRRHTHFNPVHLMRSHYLGRTHCDVMRDPFRNCRKKQA